MQLKQLALTRNAASMRHDRFIGFHFGRNMHITDGFTTHVHEFQALDPFLQPSNWL